MISVLIVMLRVGRFCVMRMLATCFRIVLVVTLCELIGSGCSVFKKGKRMHVL